MHGRHAGHLYIAPCTFAFCSVCKQLGFELRHNNCLDTAWAALQVFRAPVDSRSQACGLMASGR